MGFSGDSFARLAKHSEQGNPDLRTGKSYTRMPPEHTFNRLTSAEFRVILTSTLGFGGERKEKLTIELVWREEQRHQPY